MKFFTLLHLKESEKSLHNDSVNSFRDQINLYLQCIIRLDKSLKKTGSTLSIITNEVSYLRNLLKDYPLEIIEIEFRLEVPSGISYFSSHFKIDVFRYFASLNEKYVFLIDNDITCLNSAPAHLKGIIELGIPMFYDVTNQIIPSETRAVVLRDKQKVSSDNLIGLWFGGEFMAGPPSYFRDLVNEIDQIKESYFSNYASLFHASDEMLSAVAIERMIIKGYKILDAGGLDIIGRFWSPKPRHSQHPFDAYRNHFLLHLPSDKRFLISLEDGDLEKDIFISKYKKYLQKRRIRTFASKIKNSIVAKELKK
jgi:hypothetical protein